MALLNLLPAAILALGAVLLRRGGPRIRDRQQTIALGAAALAAVAAAVLLWAVANAEGNSLRLVLSPWATSAFQSSPALDVDLLAGVMILLLALLALFALWSHGSIAPADAIAVLSVAAAAATFAAAARSPLGLVFGWLVLDLALAIGLQGGRLTLIAGMAGLLAAVFGLASLPPGTGVLSPLAVTGASATARAWLVAAGLIRAGMYPLWWAVPLSRPYRLWASPITRLAPALAGIHLIMIVTDLTRSGQGLNTVSLLPPLVAVLAGAILAWLSDDRAAAMDWQTMHHAALVILAASLGGRLGVYLALVLLVDLVLTRAVLYVAIDSLELKACRIAGWLAAAGAAGMPPTIGFAGRWLVYRELLDYQLFGVLSVTLAAVVLATSALFVTLRNPGVPSSFSGRTAGTLVVMAITPVLLGVGYGALRVPLLSLTHGFEPSTPWGDIASTLANPITARRGALLLASILIPPIVGAVMAVRRRHPSAPELSQARRRWVEFLQLQRLAGVLARAAVHLGTLPQRSSRREGGRQTMAWTLLVVVALATAVLSGSAPPGTTAQAPAPFALLILLAAGVVGAGVLLSRVPAAMLIALAGGYALSAALLGLLIGADSAGGAVAASPIVAAIKLIAGLLAVAVLTISALQTPAIGRPDRAAQRLRLFRPTDPSPSTSRLVPALALVTVLVVIYGVHATRLPPVALPDAVLQPALALVAGGVLAVIFGASALQLACGVLLALAGFELVYARLDPGLLVTGSLAAFQLLFALVASHFVGVTDSIGSDREE